VGTASPSSSGCDVERHLAPAHAQAVHGQVVRDREGPGAPGGALRREALARRDDPHPGVLEHLVGLRREPRAQQPLDEAEQPALVARIEHVERGGVTVGVGQHQLIVGHGVALGGGFGGRGAGERRHRRIFT
jgi:hypothetical protein